MTPKQRPYQIRLTNPNAAQVSARDGTLGYVTVTNRDLARYYSLLDSIRPKLSGKDLTLLLEAYTARPTRNAALLYRTLHQNPEATDAAVRLAKRIKAMHPAEQLALLDSCERYARSPEPTPILKAIDAGLA